MERLILEISSRGEHRYQPIDRPLLRVGRALDNDIILTDPTISPHHFVIKRAADGGYWLHPLSDENGMRVGRKALRSAIALTDEDLAFEAGRTHLRVLPESTPVAPTRLLTCRTGGTCLFESWGWALGLLALFIAISLVDNYLSTPQELDWQSFGRDQTVIVAVVLGIAVGIAVLVRLIAHRWEPAAAVSFVSLMLLIATLIEQLTSLADYYYSNAATGYAADLAWAFLIAPIALYWFLVRINHANRLSSIAITLILITPAAYFQAREVTQYFGLFGSFSDEVHYPEELHPLDIRRHRNLTIDQFTSEMSASMNKK